MIVNVKINVMMKINHSSNSKYELTNLAFLRGIYFTHVLVSHREK